MTRIRIDKVVLASFIDTFLNYKTVTGSIPITGTVPNGSGANFSAVLTIDKTNTLAEVYAKNSNTGKKMSLMAGSTHNPYQAVSTETIAHSVNLSGNTLTITFTVTNFTGASIVLTNQTMNISAVLQQVPY